jgi:hypothetical protein
MEVGAERAGRGAWLGDGAADPAPRRSHSTTLLGKAGPRRRFTAVTAAPSLPASAAAFFLTQMVAVAELEAGLVSERTKAALAAAKRKGINLGNPTLAKASVSGVLSSPSLVHPAADPYLVFELAGARGLLRYVTGKSCKRDHVAERWMSASSRASAA